MAYTVICFLLRQKQIWMSNRRAVLLYLRLKKAPQGLVLVKTLKKWVGYRQTQLS